MADLILHHIIPGGTVGVGALPNQAPFDLITGKDNGSITPGQYLPLTDLVFGVNGGGTITNFVDAATGQVCFRHFCSLATTSRAYLQFGGTGLGLGGITKVAPFGSVMSGQISSDIASQFGAFFMEGCVRINPTVGGAGEIIFVFAPCWTVVGGVIGSCNGFGLAYANTLANDNYRIIVADGSGALLVNVDTGINALTAAIRHLRLEWGWINGAPRIRAIIDGVQVAEVVGPLVLNTTNRLGAFSSAITIGPDKIQADAANQLEVLTGHTGIVIGAII